MFEVLKEILKIEETPGIIVVAIILILTLVLRHVKTSQLDQENSASLSNKIIGIASMIAIIGLTSWAIINLFLTYDNSNILKYKQRKETRITDSLEIEKKLREIEIEERRLEQLKESVESKRRNVDSLISKNRDGIELEGDDDIFQPSKKVGYYSSKIEIREGRRYNDLRTGVSIIIKSIDIRNRIVDFIIDGFEHYLANEQLVIQDGGKKITFLEDGEKFEFTFFNFKKIDGERTANLNVNKID